MGYSPWGPHESVATERLHFHISLSCIGEGNGNPLQCSCLENPRDGRAWWAAVYGVAKSRTRLKRLSSSSSSSSPSKELKSVLVEMPSACSMTGFDLEALIEVLMDLMSWTLATAFMVVNYCIYQSITYSENCTNHKYTK